MKPSANSTLTIDAYGQKALADKWDIGSNFKIPGMRIAYSFPDIPTILAALVADDLTKATEGNVTEHRRVGSALSLIHI